MQLQRNGFAVTALLGLVTVFGVPQAHATAELQLSDGTNTVTVVDGDVNDQCPTADCVTYNGSVGNWNINVTTGTANDAAFPYIMDLNSVEHHNAGSAAGLTILFTDSGLTPAAPGFALQLGGVMSSGGTLTASLFGGNSNTLFDTTQQLGASMSISGSPFDPTETVGNPTSADPYSLTEMIQLSFANGSAGFASFDFNVGSVPEPASVLLLGGVLLVASSAIRRKARRA